MATNPGWNQLGPDVQAHVRRVRAGCLTVSQTYAGKMEAHAKRDAPWIDRTGNARNRLTGRAEIFDASDDSYTVGVRLAHGVSYGVWLEVENRPRGKAARPIIHPTIERFRQDYYDDCHKLMKGLNP